MAVGIVGSMLLSVVQFLLVFINRLLCPFVMDGGSTIDIFNPPLFQVYRVPSIVGQFFQKLLSFSMSSTSDSTLYKRSTVPISACILKLSLLQPTNTNICGVFLCYFQNGRAYRRLSWRSWKYSSKRILQNRLIRSLS